MPRFKAQFLREVGYELFQASGCTEEDTRAVVDHLIESNLFGHDSHGVIRFGQYVRSIREGVFQACVRPQVASETPCTAVIDAGGALGQVGATFAADLAIRKARQHGVAAVSLRNTSHVGRVGAYPLRVARAGMIGSMFTNAGRLGYQIAPFGGIDGRLSTNPVAFSVPRREADPILVDMTTSVVAEGKIRVAINRGETVPEGWLIDSDGNPTTNPADFKADPPGAILPLGGVVAHKGFALGLVVELLGGILSGQGCAAGEREMVSNGALITAYHIEHFAEMDFYYDEVEALIRHIRSSRLAPGFKEILLPGEPEFRKARQLEAEGIEVEAPTWADVCEAARELGLNPAKWG